MVKQTKADKSYETVRSICKALSEKLAADIKIVEIKGISDIADYFVICSWKSAPSKGYF